MKHHYLRSSPSSTTGSARRSPKRIACSWSSYSRDGANDEEISQTVLANPFEKFDLAVRQLLPKLMIDRMAGNDEIVSRCFNNPDFQEIVYTGLARGIYEAVMAQQEQKP